LTRQLVDRVTHDFEDGRDVTTYSRMADAPLEAGLAHFTLIDVAVPLARTARGAEGPPTAALAGDATSADVKSPASAAA
jgi:hypothetical protein